MPVNQIKEFLKSVHTGVVFLQFVARVSNLVLITIKRGKTFFKVPFSQKICTKFIHFSSLNEDKSYQKCISKKIYICSIHFSPDFIDNKRKLFTISVHKHKTHHGYFWWVSKFVMSFKIFLSSKTGIVGDKPC